jgi:Ca-activated chloride channel family protein
MSFQHPWFFLLLLLLPPLFYWRRHGTLRFWRHPLLALPTWGFANWNAVKAARPGMRAGLAFIPELLLALGLLALVVALARPVTEDYEDLEGEGLDIMVCLDMSSSMNAVDLSDLQIGQLLSQGKTPKNRFETAREVLREFITQRKGDRLGLVVFASDAWMKFPLTLDYQAALGHLNALVLDSQERERDREGCINGCTINGESTAVGDALARAYKRLADSDGKGKVIILITDGNDNASQLKPLDVAKHLGAMDDGQRPRLYTFLIGSGNDSRIPAIQRNGRQALEGGMPVYIPYESKVDEARIRELADAAKGVFQVSYTDEQFRKNFASLERGAWKEERVTLRNEEFELPLAVAMALLLGAFVLQCTVFRRFP